MNGIADLLHSERGTWCLLVFATATLLLLTGKITSEAWIGLTSSLTAILVASKTVTTSIETRTLAKPQIPTATVVSQDAAQPPPAS